MADIKHSILFDNKKELVNTIQKLVYDPLLSSSQYMSLEFRKTIRDSLISLCPESVRKPIIVDVIKPINLWVELEHRFLDVYSETTRCYSHLDHKYIIEVLKRLLFSDKEIELLYNAWIKRYPKIQSNKE